MPWSVADVERFNHGLTARQKRQWVEVANSVLRKCLADGGNQSRCEGSAIRQANGVVANQMLTSNFSNSEYEVREEVLNGIPHWVVPVIMMVEGVHHGSRGPLLYQSQELRKIVDAWNGIPVMVGHPQDDDEDYVPANSPDLVEMIVGRVYNTHFEMGKLKAEVWVDISALERISNEAFKYIKEGRPLDVSVGVFSEDIEEEGIFNGENYQGIATSFRPDHLALLPGAAGACSWDDGCGIRTNSKTKQKGGTNVKPEKGKIKKSEFLDALNAEGYGIHVIGADLNSNETGFREIMQSIQNKLNQMDNGVKIHYLEDLFDNDFVYRIENHEAGTTSFFRRNYVVQEDGGIEFSDDPVQVRKETSFVSMKRQRTKFNSKSNKQMSKVNANCDCSVDALIKNEATSFTEDDREWLDALEEEQRKKLVPKTNKAPEEPKKETQPNANSSKAEEKAEEPKTSPITVDKDGNVKVNGKDFVDVLRDGLSKEKDPDAFIGLMPEGMRSQMKAALSTYKKRREGIIEAIVDNSEFTKEQLEKWEDEQLETLHKTVVKDVVDYSAQGVTAFSRAGSSSKEDDKEEMTAMLRGTLAPKFEEKKETKNK